jgi:glycosyltransferase involved in cell wall biosynthesis
VALSYSVVIPAYNAEDHIGDAIASALNQTAAPARIIVVDDGSTDGTAERAKAFGAIVTVIRKENGGPGSATSAGFDAVTTELVATLDSDDIWLPQKMERQLARLEAAPAVMAVFSRGRTFREGEVPETVVTGDGKVIDLWTRTTMVYRTEGMREIGEMRDFPGNLGDLIDWLGRGRDLGHQHEMLDEVLALRRLRPGSLSDTRARERTRGYLVAAHAALMRRQKTDTEE